MSVCTPTEFLKQFLAGRLPGDESSSIEDHVESCPKCQARLEELTLAMVPSSEAAKPGGLAPERSALDRLKGRRPVVVRVVPAVPEGVCSLSPVWADDDPGRSLAAGLETGTPSLAASLPVIAGFDVIRELGRGGMGVVYEALELALGRRVALKVLPPMAAGLTAAERFRREARAAGKLHHTNIVPIFGVGSDGALLYYAMQLIEGEGLDRLIVRLCRDQVVPLTSRPRNELDLTRAAPATRHPTPAGSATGPPSEKSGRLTPSSGGSSLAHARSVARIGRQVADALEYAHKSGFLHRDIKPSNILIDAAGTAWIADFGLAKTVEAEEALTHTGDIVGTLRYMPPERFDGRSDARGDVYALGATLYELLTLRPAFHDLDRTQLIERVLSAEPVRPRQLDRRVPQDLETIILKAMAKDPARRYAMAGQMAEDLRRFLEGRTITARRVGLRERVVRWARRRPMQAMLSGTVTLLLASLLGLGAWSYLRISRALGEQSIARGKADKALKIESRTRMQMEQLSADLELDRGIALAEDGLVGRGLFWMLRSLEHAPPDALGLRRAARANLAAWRDQAIVPRRIIINSDKIVGIALDRDSPTAVTGDSAGNLRRWDLTSGRLLGSVHAHEGELAMTSLPDGRVIATGGRASDSTARLWDPRSLKPLGEPMRHEPGSTVMPVFSPDGKVLLTYCSGEKAVSLWDAATSRSLVTPMIHPGVHRAVFSPDGTRLATTSKARDARFWDVATGRPLGEPLPHDNIVWGAAFSPDGRRLATVDGNYQELGDPSLKGRVRIWEVATGRLIAAGPTAQPGFASVTFRPDGRKIIAGGFDGLTYLFDAETAQSRSSTVSHTEPVGVFDFSPDGRTVLTGSPDRTVRLVDAETGRLLGSVMEHNGDIRGAVFGDDGQTIVTGSYDGSLRVWDSMGADSRGYPLPHPSGVQTVEFSPDGQLLATASHDGSARIFDMATGQPRCAPLLHAGQVRVARFRPDGKVIATGGDDNMVRLWDVTTGRPVGPALPHGNWVVNLRFSPDGNTLLAGRVEGEATLWDLTTSPPRDVLLHHPRKLRGDEVWHLEFTRDGRVAMTGSMDGSLGFWDATTGARLGDFLKFSPVMQQIRLDPSGRRLFVLANERVHQVDWQNRRTIAEPLGQSVLIFAISPDGSRLLTGGKDKAARLWEADTGRPIGPTMRLDNAVRSVAFSPDGATSATLSGRGRLQFWDASTSKPIGPHREHAGWVPRFGCDDRQPLTFAPDGRTLLTTGGGVVAWPVPDGDVQDRARLLGLSPSLFGFQDDGNGDPRRLSPAEWSQALIERAYDGSARPPPPLAWHDRTAVHCEQFGPLGAARWHLDHLIAARPDAGALWARRARVLRRLGETARAEADESRAVALGPPGRVFAWRMHDLLDRSTAAEVGGRLTEALALLDALVEGIGEDAALRVRRGEVHARLGRWADAAVDLDAAYQSLPPFPDYLGRSFRRRLRSAELPPERFVSERLILCRLGAGDREGYRATCSSLRQQAARDDPGLALFLVYLSTLGPDGSSDPTETVALADRAITGLSDEEASPARRYAGAALYRASRYAEAIGQLEADCRRGGPAGRPWDWAFLAMAHARLGHTLDARRWLDRLRAHRPGAAPIRFLDDLELDLLRREAESVVLLDPAFPADPFARPGDVVPEAH
jgi:eukaryotic-like serine/threonine-protein kinase